MTEEAKLAQARAVDAAIRAYYLSFPNRTAEGWEKVMRDPRKYNRLWRHMLKHAGRHDLEINHFPPPIYLQHLVPGKRT